MASLSRDERDTPTRYDVPGNWKSCDVSGEVKKKKIIQRRLPLNCKQRREENGALGKLHCK